MKSKGSVRSFAGLVEYANERALNSLRRNDPWAWAYWKETAAWAKLLIVSVNFLRIDLEKRDVKKLCEYTSFLVKVAAEHVGKREYAEAARAYSRAKWVVILSRNNGLKMPPKKTGVNLDWLRGFEAVKQGKVPSWS